MSRRNSNSEQGELWRRDECLVSVADKCLFRCATGYLDGIGMVPLDTAPPKHLDDYVFACLLLCSEYGHRFTFIPHALLEMCRSTAEERDVYEPYNELPWSLAIEAVNGGIKHDGTPLRRLIESLDHPNSGVRRFMFETGWFLNRHLNAESCAIPLLGNVAGTLGSWWMSLGLYYSLFKKADDFWMQADLFAPPDPRFESQYRDRIQKAKAFGLGFCLFGFYALETRVRKLVDDTAMGLASVKD